MDESTGTGLPPSLEAAWGVRGRPAKGPKPGLTLERIVEAAVHLAASEGLAAVSMSRVATALGASAMGLYRYVAAKDELLALMLDAVTGPPPTDLPRPGEGWRTGLSRWAFAERAVLRQNPWVAHLPLNGPPVTPNQIGWLERGLRCLGDTSLDEGEKLSVILLVSGFVWRDATLVADIEAAMGSDKWRQVAADWGRTLAKLIDEERFPAISAMIASGILDEPDEPDYDFTFGLERILDGIDAHIRARV
jgi:AcrR family transcriptional regulator